MYSKCNATGTSCKMRMLEKQASPSTTTESVHCLTMEPKKFLTSENSWQKLQEYYTQTGKNLVIKDLFSQDPNRFNKYR